MKLASCGVLPQAEFVLTDPPKRRAFAVRAIVAASVCSARWMSAVAPRARRRVRSSATIASTRSPLQPQPGLTSPSAGLTNEAQMPHDCLLSTEPRSASAALGAFVCTGELCARQSAASSRRGSAQGKRLFSAAMQFCVCSTTYGGGRLSQRRLHPARCDLAPLGPHLFWSGKGVQQFTFAPPPAPAAASAWCSTGSCCLGVGPQVRFSGAVFSPFQVTRPHSVTSYSTCWQRGGGVSSPSVKVLSWTQELARSRTARARRLRSAALAAAGAAGAAAGTIAPRDGPGHTTVRGQAHARRATAQPLLFPRLHFRPATALRAGGVQAGCAP